MSVFGFEPVNSHWGRIGVDAEKNISESPRGVFSRHTWPHFLWEGRSVQKEKQQNPLPPHAVQTEHVSNKKGAACFCPGDIFESSIEDCFHFICPKCVLLSSNLVHWDISSHASHFHNDILVFLIQSHPCTLKILILPWCLHISNICSPLKRYQAHREIEVHIWKT